MQPLKHNFNSCNKAGMYAWRRCVMAARSGATLSLVGDEIYLFGGTVGVL